MVSKHTNTYSFFTQTRTNFWFINYSTGLQKELFKKHLR